ASQLFATLSVLDNVLVALRGGRLGFDAFALTDRDPDRRELAENLLAVVGYRGGPYQPAGGRSRAGKPPVQSPRAAGKRAGLLALDEPAAGLSAADKAELRNLLRKVAEAGIAVVLVEHDVELVMAVSSHVVVLDAGAKIAQGPPGHVATNDAVLEAYLGRSKSVDRKRVRAIALSPT